MQRTPIALIALVGVLALTIATREIPAQEVLAQGPASPTPSPTLTAVATDTPPPTATASATAVSTATPTPTPTSIPTITATLTSSPTITPTLTASPTVTPTPAPSDLAILMFASPDPVVSGGIVTYHIRVVNVGTSGTNATEMIHPLPFGAALEFLGYPCRVRPPATVSCDVPALLPGRAAEFEIGVVAHLDGGLLFGTAIVDPNNALGETNEANNVMTVATTVFPRQGPPPPPPGPFPPPIPTQPPAPTAVPQVFPAFVPQQPPPRPAPTQGDLWLQIEQPTQALSVSGTPLWVASPGEWYFVVKQESGWALAVWEGDTPEWSVWILLDARARQVVANRPRPSSGQLWLAVSSPTQAYSVTMSPMWVAATGEWYRVVLTEGDWVLAVWERDPPQLSVWIQVDTRVRLTRA